jgi:hypothetical protein
VDHLFASAVRIERMGLTASDGVASMDWVPVPGGEFVRCRLDLNFLRPGKDIAPAPVAGKAPDRIGLMFCAMGTPLQAGDRIVTIPNASGAEPVSGTFEVRVIPDVVVGYSSAHHLEIQILETNQALDGRWPDDDAEEG